MRSLLIIFLFALIPSWALAGPWPREQGKTFGALSSLVSAPYDTPRADLDLYHALYVEHGLARQLTFGIDAGANALWHYSVIGFIRAPILQSAEQHRFAVQIGAGIKEGANSEQLLQAGFSWGRGLETPLGSGWATLDTQAHFLLGSGDLVTKADLTIGVKPTDRWKVMMQLQAANYPGAKPVLRLAPSVAFAVAPDRHIELGAQTGLLNESRFGFKIGSWIEF